MTTPPRDVALARRIAERHGADPATVDALPGVGRVNHVHIARRGDEQVVIRFAIDPLRADEFDAERWCIARARAAGITAPAPVAHGSLDGVPYLVLQYVPGRPGTEIAPEHAWHRLGRFAADVAALEPGEDAPAGLFSRFGRDLPAAWRAHVRYNLDALGGGDPLIARRVYAAADAQRLAAVIRSLLDAPLTFGLSHGDLAPRNMIVQEGTGQDAALIDWGGASAGPAPWTDLEMVYRWHLTALPEGFEVPVTADDLAAFARGCGIELAAVTPLLEALVLLRSLDLARWAKDVRPDLLPQYAAEAARLVGRFLAGGQPV